MKPSCFIEVHALCDGKAASIRADQIDAVFDNDEADIDGAHKPACRTISFSGGRSLDVTEEYDDIMNMIWNAEL